MSNEERNEKKKIVLVFPKLEFEEEDGLYRKVKGENIFQHFSTSIDGISDGSTVSNRYNRVMD